MTEQMLAVKEEDPVLETDFIKALTVQMRALDVYGSREKWSDAKVLDPFVLTKERKAAIPIVGDPDGKVKNRVIAFYNALASLVEKECGLMPTSLVHLSGEGFGRAIITVGKLVIVDKTLRDVHRFGFDSLSRMKDEADKLLSIALQLIGKYSDVARL